MSGPGIALVEGIDVDALAAAVRSCPAVHDLDRGALGSIATYLPGRQLAGIRIEQYRVSVQVRVVWDVPVGELGVQVRRALAPLIGGRIVDIVVAALSDPTAQDIAMRDIAMRDIAAKRPASSVSVPQDVAPVEKSSGSPAPTEVVRHWSSDRSWSKRTSAGAAPYLAWRAASRTVSRGITTAERDVAASKPPSSPTPGKPSRTPTYRAPSTSPSPRRPAAD